MPIGISRYCVPFKTPVLPEREPVLSKTEVKQKQREAYYAALPVFNKTVTLVSYNTVVDPIRRMRVRGSKPGQGKRGTMLDLLAKGERKFNQHGEISIVKNDGFNKFNELYYRDQHVHCTLPELCAAFLNKAHLQRLIKRTKQNINSYTVKYAFVTKSLNTQAWTYNRQLMPVRQIQRTKCTAIADTHILTATNSLLRQILLFKGIGFAQIEQDIRENGGKPMTYMVNTTIEYDADDTGIAALVKCYKVHKITVKKTFRNTINNGGTIEQECKLFFSSECCRNVTQWLKSFNINI